MNTKSVIVISNILQDLDDLCKQNCQSFQVD